MIMMKTFLIVKIAAIGDVIMALPMAVEIKEGIRIAILHGFVASLSNQS